MIKSAHLLLLLFIFSTFALAQHSSAPGGFWPVGYYGDTWTGVVKSVNPDTREITLSYTDKKGQEETFTGVLKPDYKHTKKDGSTIEVQVQQIPTGVYMVAYYMPKTKKENGHKTKYYEIFDFTLSKDKPAK